MSKILISKRGFARQPIRIQKLESTLAKVTEAASLEEALRDEDQHGFDVARVTRDAVEEYRTHRDEPPLGH